MITLPIAPPSAPDPSNLTTLDFTARFEDGRESDLKFTVSPRWRPRCGRPERTPNVEAFVFTAKLKVRPELAHRVADALDHVVAADGLRTGSTPLVASRDLLGRYLSLNTCMLEQIERAIEDVSSARVAALSPCATQEGDAC